jgi:hypothetical protein
MIQLSAALPALFQHWRLGLVIIAAILAFHGQYSRLASEKALERSRGELTVARLQQKQADEAVKALRRDSARRAAEQTRLVDEARRLNRSDEADRGVGDPRPFRGADPFAASPRG